MFRLVLLFFFFLLLRRHYCRGLHSRCRDIAPGISRYFSRSQFRSYTRRRPRPSLILAKMFIDVLINTPPAQGGTDMTFSGLGKTDRAQYVRFASVTYVWREGREELTMSNETEYFLVGTLLLFFTIFHPGDWFLFATPTLRYITREISKKAGRHRFGHVYFSSLSAPG